MYTKVSAFLLVLLCFCVFVAEGWTAWEGEGTRGGCGRTVQTTLFLNRLELGRACCGGVVEALLWSRSSMTTLASLFFLAR